MDYLIIEIMNKFGYIGVGLLIFIENVFPPIPSELVLTFAGFMTTTSKISIVGIIIASTIGSLCGAIVLYLLGKILNKERLIKIVKSKYGKLLRIKPKDIESADEWFDNKGNKTVFFCRFVPIVRSLISIPAGMSEMPLWKFIIYTLFGSLIWNSALILVGAYAGDKKDIILRIINDFSYVVLLGIIIGMFIFTYKFYKKRIKKKAK